MNRYTPADIKIEFESTIRNAHVYVEASAWSDEDGIYKTQLNDVYLDGVSVLGLLTEQDLSDLDDQIEPAISGQDNDFNASRDAFQLGE